MDNVSKLRVELARLNLDGLFITNPRNLRYLSGFTGADSMLLVGRERQFFITDARYTEQAHSECPAWEIVDWRNQELPLWRTIDSLVQAAKAARLGVEATNITYGTYLPISSNLTNLQLVPTTGLIEQLRSVKSEQEIAWLCQAAEITDRVIDRLLADIKPGVTELALSHQIVSYIWDEGGESRTTTPIILAGARTSLLHGIPSQNRVQRGDLVLMDFGASVNGYHADISKTVVVGKATAQQREIYQIEQQALIAQIAAMQAGASARAPYAASAAVMRGTAYLPYHYDKVGHGVGLDIHESPFMSPKTDDVFVADQIVTAEPGMYIPGWGGVRIEDMVWIKADGNQILNRISRDLIEL